MTATDERKHDPVCSGNGKYSCTAGCKKAQDVALMTIMRHVFRMQKKS